MNFINICFDKKLDIIVFLMFLWFSYSVSMQFYYLEKMCIFDLFFLPNLLKHPKMQLMALKDVLYMCKVTLKICHYKLSISVNRVFKLFCLLALYNIVSVFWIFYHPTYCLLLGIIYFQGQQLNQFFLAYCILLQQKYR